MTEPTSIAQTSADRLAALRAPSSNRQKPAHTSKILSAGISTTALFGMVAVMGWPSTTGNAQSADAAVAATQAVTPAPPTLPLVAPPTTPAEIPAAVPAVVPAVVVTVPVDPPTTRTPPAPIPSNTTTKTSG
jgi:hypothetical protein